MTTLTLKGLAAEQAQHALTVNHDTTIQTLECDEVNFNEHTLDAFETFLKNNPISNLSLVNCSVSHSLFAAMLTAVQQPPHRLQHLVVDCDKSYVPLIADFLYANHSLKTLSVSGLDYAGAKILFPLLATHRSLEAFQYPNCKPADKDALHKMFAELDHKHLMPRRNLIEINANLEDLKKCVDSLNIGKGVGYSVENNDNNSTNEMNANNLNDLTVTKIKSFISNTESLLNCLKENHSNSALFFYPNVELDILKARMLTYRKDYQAAFECLEVLASLKLKKTETKVALVDAYKEMGSAILTHDGIKLPEHLTASKALNKALEILKDSVQQDLNECIHKSLLSLAHLVKHSNATLLHRLHEKNCTLKRILDAAHQNIECETNANTLPTKKSRQSI